MLNINKNSMKIEEFFDKIAPMVASIAMDADTSLLAIGADAEREYGAIKGNPKEIIVMIVQQMIQQKDIEQIIMCSAEAYMDYLRDMANAEGQQQILS